jgi:hypothetical protein
MEDASQRSIVLTPLIWIGKEAAIDHHRQDLGGRIRMGGVGGPTLHRAFGNHLC